MSGSVGFHPDTFEFQSLQFPDAAFKKQDRPQSTASSTTRKRNGKNSKYHIMAKRMNHVINGVYVS